MLQTYGDTSRKDDVVLNAVEVLTAVENQVLSLLPKSVAIDTVHSYLVDTLATAASAAVQQGADYTFGARTAATRITNIVEEIAFPFRVSQLQNVVEHYHGQNELERQLTMAMKEWGNAAEFDLVRSTLVSGVSGTVAKMNGIIASVSNTTAHTSGTVFSATILDGLMQLAWDNSNGDTPTDLFVGGIMRRAIDNFVQKSNNVTMSTSQNAIVKTVATYETAFGVLNVRRHRYVDIQGTDATSRVLAIRPEKLAIAYLEKPFVQTDLSKNGPYEPRAIYGSLTLEVRNPRSHFFASGFLRSA